MIRWWRRRSLRARLTLVASATVALGLVAGAAALGLAFTRSRIDQLDAGIRQRADLVRQLTESDRLPQVLPADVGGAELVEVVDQHDVVLAASVSASRTLAVLAPEQLASWPRDAPRSYDDERLTGTPLRIVLLDATTAGPVAGVPAGARVTVIAAVPLRDVRDTLGALRRTLLVVLPLLLLAVGTGSWLLTGSALRPVGELRRGAERISDVGGGGVLPIPPGADEVARLAGTLNRMLDRLALAGARQRVFLADAAHELRSPLTALRTQLEVAQAHPRTPGERAVATEVLPEVLRLARLVDDLLMLARLDERPAPAGGPVDTSADTSADTSVDLVAVVTRAVSGMAGVVAEPPGSRPVVTVSGSGSARGDPEDIRRVVQNLLDNARRHARSRVDITLTPGELSVTDDGAGIAPADRERVFERFTRLDDARTRDRGGSGLGLAIARELARCNGGELTVETGPGGGATFRLVLR